MNNKQEEHTNIFKNLLWVFLCVPLITLVIVELIPVLSLGKSIISMPSFNYCFAIIAALFAYMYVFKIMHYYNYILNNLVKKEETKAKLSSFKRKNFFEVLILFGAIIICVLINIYAETIPCIWNISGMQIASAIYISSMYLVSLQILTIRYNSNSVYRVAKYIRDVKIACMLMEINTKKEKEKEN